MANLKEKKTLVKGFVIDPNEQTFEAFEIETPYTRSAEKAAKFATELLKIEPSQIVTVTTIHNEKVERKHYNNSKLVELSDDWTRNEAEAGDDWRRAKIYEISGAVWVVDSTGKYETEFISFTTPTNYTKTNLRQAVAEHAYNEAIAVHDCTKNEVDVWCKITSENLAKCEIKKSEK